MGDGSVTSVSVRRGAQRCFGDRPVPPGDPRSFLDTPSTVTRNAAPTLLGLLEVLHPATPAGTQHTAGAMLGRFQCTRVSGLQVAGVPVPGFRPGSALAVAGSRRGSAPRHTATEVEGDLATSFVSNLASLLSRVSRWTSWLRLARWACRARLACNLVQTVGAF